MFDIITIGSATRDAFLRSKDFRVIADPAAPTGQSLALSLGAKLEIHDLVFTTGGGATNTAVTFSRQGFKTAIICAVGGDVAGGAIREELKNEGIETQFVRAHPKLPTGYSVLLHPREGGERTVLVYRGASETMRPADIPWPDLAAKWFYVSSLAGNISLLGRILAFARAHGIVVAYNPGGKELAMRARLVPLLKKVQVLIVNREEAALITGAPFEKEREIFRKWDELTPGININVMTDARNGVMVSDGGMLYRAGIYPEKNVLDRTGAGDAFGSGFVAGLMRGWERGSSAVSPEIVERAIRLGTANATAKVEGIGAKHGLLTRTQFEHDRRWRGLRVERMAL